MLNREAPSPVEMFKKVASTPSRADLSEESLASSRDKQSCKRSRAVTVSSLTSLLPPHQIPVLLRDTRTRRKGRVARPLILSTQPRLWVPRSSRFSKGGYHERRQQRTLHHTLTTPDPETKSLPIPHSLAPTLLLPTSSADNCSTATALAIPLAPFYFSAKKKRPAFPHHY